MKANRDFYKMVFSLVIPIALQNLINVGVQSADVIMLGKVNETVLSGASLGGQLSFIMNLIFFGLTSGATVLTAQYWGKGDKKAIESILGIALRISLIISLIFSVAAFAFARPVIKIFTSDPLVIEEGIKYLNIIGFSYIFTAFTMVYLNVMRSLERVVVSTVIYLNSLIANIILNALFIYGLFGIPAMGIRGAALATVCARVLEFILVLYYDKKINNAINFKVKLIIVKNKELFHDFVKYSIPVVINELMWGLGIAAVAAILGNMNTSAAATNSVIQIFRQLAMVVSFGVASASAIILGKYIGEGKKDIAKEYSVKLIKLSLITGCLGAAVILFVKPFILNSMSLSVLTRDYLDFMMYIMVCYVICQSFTCNFIVGIFRSGGDTKFGLYIELISLWGFAILFGSIAAFVLKWSVPVVFILVSIDELVKTPFVLWRYKKYKWLNDVTR